MKLASEPNPRDLLSELVEDLRVESVLYCYSQLAAPWGFSTGEAGVASFHLVLGGSCLLELPIGDTRHLREGDLVLIMDGVRHKLKSGPAAPVVPLAELLQRHGFDGSIVSVSGDGPLTNLLCGGLTIADNYSRGLLRLLPSPLVLSPQDGEQRPWLSSTASMLGSELKAPSVGSQAAAKRLADLLLTSAIRDGFREVQGADKLQGAMLHDGAVAESVRLMRADLARRWTVSELASRAAMSRSSFSQRFRAATSSPAMRYLADVRLNGAARLLRGTEASVQEIATQVGYASESSFTRAFRRRYGTLPSAYRRQP